MYRRLYLANRLHKRKSEPLQAAYINPRPSKLQEADLEDPQLHSCLLVTVPPLLLLRILFHLLT